MNLKITTVEEEKETTRHYELGGCLSIVIIICVFIIGNVLIEIFGK